MRKEADFYSSGEAAKALGIPERQVFGMVVSGELEGQQDEWGRWRIPASAIRRAREASGSLMDDVELSAASDDATTISIGSPPPWKSPGASNDKSDTLEESDQEATQRLPPGGYQGPLSPDVVSGEAAQGLSEDLQARLDSAERARSRLEEEVRRLEEENKRLREELGVERDKGVFGKLFRE